jgi:hypothetical protein
MQDEQLRQVGRAGYVVVGVVHVLIGVLALQLAFGGSSSEASPTGAIATLAEQPFGRVLVWIVTVGFAALAGWQGVVAVRGEASDGFERAKAAGRAVTYAVLTVVAGRFAVGATGGGGGGGEQEAASTLLDLPAGQFLVGAVGVGIIAVGGYYGYKGVTKGFLDDLEAGATSGTAGTVVERTGQVGYLAKGVALAIVGVLFVTAAVNDDARAAGGLDQALTLLGQQAYGQVLLTLVALGLAAFGVYCFARARYERG